MLLIDADTLWSDGTDPAPGRRGEGARADLGAGLHSSTTRSTRAPRGVLARRWALHIDLASRAAVRADASSRTTDPEPHSDDSLLVLREDDETLWLYDTQQSGVLRSIDLRDQDHANSMLTVRWADARQRAVAGDEHGGEIPAKRLHALSTDHLGPLRLELFIDLFDVF